MLEKAGRLLLGQGEDHLAEDHGDVREALIRLADVGQTRLIQQYLLKDERGHRLGQLRAALHDAQAQRNDFRC